MNRLPPLPKQGLYDPAFEHDACGVGVVANLSGRKTHRIIQQAIEIVEPGELDPETIGTPAVYVDRLVCCDPLEVRWYG